jgi:hypothetical protein
MFISNSAKENFYQDVFSIIEQMGRDVILRIHDSEKDYRDYNIRSVDYNLATNTTKSINQVFNTPGATTETGYVFIFSYRDIGVIPKTGDLILIPSVSTHGILSPIKIIDAFKIGEVVPVIIDNMLLFLYLNCSRSEINTWS